MADYYKRKVAPLEGVACFALAAETLAGTSGTAGSKEGHQGSTLAWVARAAAGTVPAVASHRSTEAWRSLWWGIAAAGELSEGGKVEELWQKGHAMEAPQSTGPELAATWHPRVHVKEALFRRVHVKEARGQRVPGMKAQRRRVPEAKPRWRRGHPVATGTW
jgi:hypothetical protein